MAGSRKLWVWQWLEEVARHASIGYYGVPGKVGRSKTHIVFRGEPICGSRLGPKSEYQWCCHVSHRCTVKVECKICAVRLQDLDRKHIAARIKACKKGK